jgi:hypothetical protein
LFSAYAYGWVVPYLTEDYASERARRCGYRLVADTTIRLQHIGAYGYSLWPK